MNVEVLGRVNAGAVGRIAAQPEMVMGAGERAQVTEVEDGAEVHVEALGALAGEHPDAAAELVHGGRGRSEKAAVLGNVRAHQKPAGGNDDHFRTIRAVTKCLGG